MQYLLIDYGVSNTKSVERALLAAGFTGTTVEKINDFQPSKEQLIVLPGIGSFDQGVQNLLERGWYELLKHELKDDFWILGICLGFQLLGKSSAEGKSRGLGLIPYDCVSVSELQKNEKCINSGWRLINPSNDSSLKSENYFYFTHSFAFDHSEVKNNNAVKDFSIIKETNIISHLIYKKIIGIQFHPEKSHNQGIQMLASIGRQLDV